MRVSMKSASVALACALALTATACGGGSSDSPSSASDGGSDGKSLEGSGEIAIFMPNGGLGFNTKLREGAEATLKEYGYTVKVFENAYDQAEQDRQVQQYIATGAKPAGIIFYPPAPEAAVNSARQLARLAPLAWSTTTPVAEGAPLGGASHPYTGQLMAETYTELIAKLEADGTELKNDGAILVYNAPETLAPGKQRLDSFKETLGDADIIGEENGMVDRDSGYALATSTLAKYGDDFDIVWALNLTGAEGVAQALKEQGRVPGKDVWIISGGDCSSGLASVENGDVYSTIGQSGSVDGVDSARVLLQLIANGETQPGEMQYDVTADVPELVNEAPMEYTFSPQITITKDNISDVQMWGEDASQICPA